MIKRGLPHFCRSEEEVLLSEWKGTIEELGRKVEELRGSL